MLPHDKKRWLLARKKELSLEILYYDRKIEETRRKIPDPETYEVIDDDDSDSDPGFPMQSEVDHHTTAQLKIRCNQLSTCLQATQELTGLQIIQSDVKVMVEPPELERGDHLPSEDGDWKEVLAECKVDKVQFSMLFYVHQPHRKFAAPSFHGMQVKLVKKPHDKELEGSVLNHVKRPSDVVQLLKSYSCALRSRRDSLTKLDSKYEDHITIDVAPEGGFLLKCAGVLQLTWTLQCKKSILANFQHQIKCELEYMDKQYIRSINNAYKKLSDPSLTTNQRTLVLAEIISTCIEVATGTESSVQETSDLDAELQSDNQDQEQQLREIMAPPKQIPKKAKSKVGKENVLRADEGRGETEKQGRKRHAGEGGEAKDIAKAHEGKLVETDVANRNRIIQKDNANKDAATKEPETKKQKVLKEKHVDSGANKLSGDKEKNDVPAKKSVAATEKKQIDAVQKTVSKDVKAKTNAKQVSDKNSDINNKGKEVIKPANERITIQKEVEDNKNQDKNVKKTVPTQKSTSKPSSKVDNEEKVSVATNEKRPHADKAKSVATVSNNKFKNTDLIKNTDKNLIKPTEAAKKSNLIANKKEVKPTENNLKKTAGLATKIPKAVNTKIPVKIPTNKDPKTISSLAVMKKRLSSFPIKMKQSMKPLSSQNKAVIARKVATSTPRNSPRLTKKPFSKV